METPDKSKPNPYDLAGDDAPPPPPGGALPPIPPIAPASQPPSAESGYPKAKLAAPGLLEGFSDDADFSKDPQVEAALKPGGSSLAAAAAAPLSAASVQSGEPFVREGMGDAKILAIAGGVLTIGALVASGMNATHSTAAKSLLTLYSVLLHTGTGVVAVMIAAAIAERRLGNMTLTGARMLLAVAATALVFHLNISLANLGKTEEIFLAAAAYVGVVALFFRWPRRELMTVTIAHFALWVIVTIGLVLASWANVAGSVADRLAAPSAETTTQPAPQAAPK